ncbi:MAG TPA: fatty acid desaturase [Thermoanaerobaculia bacterium]|jgi:stearoyl-CoA desaturase (delta-9 desaturase)|nr:fatty acid desaturase [Thermoanaerobaculia bacterium]
MIEPMSEHRQLTLTWKALPFVLCHVMTLFVFFVPFSWGLLALCLGLYVLRMFGITAGYHRYFSHRSYKTSRAFQLVMAVLGALSLQKGPLWWAAHHRHHHRHSDRHGDLHSPGLQGFLWAHVGWVVSGEHDETGYDKVADLASFPELVWLNRWHALPGVLLAVALFAAGGFPALVWGFFASTVLTWHATFAINSLTHLFGRRRFHTRDDSRNSLLLALLTLGEGWHNNHHYYKASTRQGFFWWEVDVSYYLLRALAALGLVWELKEPPRMVVARAAGEVGELLDPLRRGRLAEVLPAAAPAAVEDAA